MATRPLLTPSVLLVSDALDEREMYARILRASGYQAFEAATVIAAYQIASTRRIDIVATDVRIGGSISGLELTRRLRNNERTSTVPIIVLTDVSRPQDGDVAVKAGANTFLEKPVPDNVLMAAILRLLRLSRRRSRHMVVRVPLRDTSCRYELLTDCARAALNCRRCVSDPSLCVG
jgi:two-component system, cell cycle response regulator DivK